MPSSAPGAAQRKKIDRSAKSQPSAFQTVGLIRRLRIKAHYVLILPLIWLLLSALPIPPRIITTGVDASWNYALNIAHAKGFKFGTELVYTMGPLGYLATPDPDYTGKGPVLAFLAITYVLLAYGILRCAWIAGIGAAVTAAAVLVTQALLSQHFVDVWQAAYMSVLLAAAASTGGTLADLAISGLVAGVTLLLKINEGITACAVFACLLAYSLYRHRAGKAALFSIAALPFLVLLSGMWMIQGSALSAFPYLRQSFDTVSGYSRAMSVPGPLWQSGLAMLYFVLIFAAPVLLGARSTWLGPGVLPALIIAFAAFKHGMVRQDGHADVVEVKIAIAALFIMLACSKASDRRILGALALFGASFTGFVLAENQPSLYNLALGRLRPSGMADSIRALSSFSQPWEAIRASMHNYLLPLRLDPQFSRIVNGATVDAFPENIDVIRANGWNYRPRPGLQSSSAYDPHLDELNAEYIDRGEASQFALFVWYAIDARHPFLQDPRTLRALLDNYRLVYKDDKALLLTRRLGRRFRDPELIGATVASWNQVVPVPAVGPLDAVMARIDIAPSTWGGIRAMLFRASPVNVQVAYQSGRAGAFRVVSSNLAAGAIISPLPLNLSEFSSFLDAQPSRDPVVSVMWYSPASTLEYRKNIGISWYRISTSAR